MRMAAAACVGHLLWCFSISLYRFILAFFASTSYVIDTIDNFL